jgi:hypothetical protein
MATMATLYLKRTFTLPLVVTLVVMVVVVVDNSAAV